MKNIIDAGAHLGQSIERLSKKFAGTDFQIFSFEPHPRAFLKAKEKESHNIFVEQKAVWINNEKNVFFCDSLEGSSKPGQGSTFFESKVKNKKSRMRNVKPYDVDSFDFSQWIMEKFQKEDFIYLKMDIEGAEYPVLKKMIEEGSINYINVLDIEFHWEKISLAKEEHDHILEKLYEIKNLSVLIQPT